ncbi:AbrB/MazE/SpoVT family DNA-binding domain-containing protein [Paenibacillus gallinarum]|uniref:AbrB/MazE/SpoVT family DNA-binding domain-containing protein n=1 Tax=Paenibacillus gallinarum TaxID=2762232 RepID=A0ABR8T4T7_9BACL|nr:AbrB/MazE/SpoVT family DNA-binding domain-containing protein [Paenibacillus gallinarum]
MGRIVIPSKVRETMEIKIGDSVEILIDTK